MKSTLNGLIISDYKQDNSLVFIDMSVYNPILPIDEATLTITTPYSINPIPIFYNVKGNTIITTITLERDTTMSQIPCGLYKFKQSICPHDKLYNEFWYVHVGGAKQKVAKLYCKNKIKEAIELDSKLNALEALTYCKDESKILALLEDIDCCTTTCKTNVPMNKIVIPKNCNCLTGTCNKPTCSTCN